MMRMTLRNCFYSALLLMISVSTYAEDKLRIYAASSMTNAVNELVNEFEKQHDVSTTTVFAGTSSLARQIEQGAPVDLFIAANTKWMDYLVKQKVIQGDAVTRVARNQLVVVAPIGQKGTLDIKDSQSWLNYLQGQRLAIGQTNAVPAGIYAKQSLEHLSVWPQLKRLIAPTNNVRIALALVERSEVPLGIVYKTDALMSSGVKVLATLPHTSHSPIVYPMAQLNTKPQTDQFVQFIESDKAQQIMQSFGFEIEQR